MACLLRNVMELLGQLVSLGLGTPNRKIKFVNKISHIFSPFLFTKYELPPTCIDMYKFPRLYTDFLLFFV